LFPDSSEFLQANAGIMPYNRPQPLPRLSY
jgi:hypothetical protein